MGDIINVVTKDTAEKITTNRNSRSKHIDLYLMRGGRLVIEACEDHKYCYWLSKQQVEDTNTIADILSVVLYEDYDYVAHSVYLYSKLALSQSQILESVKVTIKKVNDQPGIGFEAPWGADDSSKSNEENGLFFAKGLLDYYQELKARAKGSESNPEVLSHFDTIERTLDNLSGNLDRDYAKIRPLLNPMWQWNYIRLSDNEKFRLRYERLLSNLSSIYNKHMSTAR